MPALTNCAIPPCRRLPDQSGKSGTRRSPGRSRTDRFTVSQQPARCGHICPAARVLGTSGFLRAFTVVPVRAGGPLGGGCSAGVRLLCIPRVRTVPDVMSAKGWPGVAVHCAPTARAAHGRPPVPIRRKNQDKPHASKRQQKHATSTNTSNTTSSRKNCATTTVATGSPPRPDSKPQRSQPDERTPELPYL
jgi:hypothetical protein